MKINKLAAGLLLVMATACSEDFLEVKPKTFVSSSSFFETEEQFKQAVNGAYTSLRSIYNDGYIMGEMRSDNTHYIYKANDRGLQNSEREEIADFTDDPLNRYSNSKYFSCYEGISRANAILDRIDAAKFSDEAKNNIVGQAKFLRAFYYFELVQYFGDVPLYLKEVKTQAETALPRSSKAEVYNVIIADAKDAIAKLPVTQAEKGRVTKGSANTLLAHVYMTQKNYAEAEKLLKEVTTMGYALLPDYASVFDPAKKNSQESVFEIQYMEGNQGQQSSWTYQFIPGLTNTKVITGVVGNNQIIGGWNTPSEDLIASYEAGDKRKAASIADGYTDSDGKFVAQPFVKKFLHPHAIYNNTNNNWPVYRYADVLLLLAEALNEQGKSAEALPYLNQVRRRAGLADISETNKAALTDIIAHERRVELAFENHRWLDLVRTGKAVEVMNTYGAKTKKQHAYLLPRTYSVNQNRLVFPIPQRERTLNASLTQNAGY